MTSSSLIGFVLVLASFSIAAKAEFPEKPQPETRPATVTDAAGSTSKVSQATVSPVLVGFQNIFGFWDESCYGRIVVSTKNIAFSIPLRAVSVIDSADCKTWTVKYQTKDGETTLSGTLTSSGTLTGDSDFGLFKLPFDKLKRLEFKEAGVAAPPIRRRRTAFGGIAVITLTDGTTIQASNLLRRAIWSAQGENMVTGRRTGYSQVGDDSNDFVFIHGEASQTLPFEKLKEVDFTATDSVTVIAKSDAKAEMKLSKKMGERVDGFSGAGPKGDFYITAEFVKSITFADKPAK